MRKFAVLLLSVSVLAGCRAAGLKKAEENTRLAGTANPLGAAIHLPIWVAATVANAGFGATGVDEVTLENPVFQEGPVVEKRCQRWRPGLPEGISREAYEALSHEVYEALMKKAGY